MDPTYSDICSQKLQTMFGSEENDFKEKLKEMTETHFASLLEAENELEIRTNEVLSVYNKLVAKRNNAKEMEEEIKGILGSAFEMDLNAPESQLIDMINERLDDMKNENEVLKVKIKDCKSKREVLQRDIHKPCEDIDAFNNKLLQKSIDKESYKRKLECSFITKTLSMKCKITSAALFDPKKKTAEQVINREDYQSEDDFIDNFWDQIQPSEIFKK